MTPSDALLQEMLDEFQLRKLVHGYDHGAFSTGTADEFLDELAAARPFIRSMHHNVTTANFAVNGSAAEGEIYTIATHTFAAGDRDVDVIVGGRYLDNYEKRSGTWKFIERKIVTDWAHVNDPSSVDLSHPMTRDTPRGRPDANDPSYQFFSLLPKGTSGVRHSP
jgi:hypothetical protein